MQLTVKQLGESQGSNRSEGWVLVIGPECAGEHGGDVGGAGGRNAKVLIGW